MFAIKTLLILILFSQTVIPQNWLKLDKHFKLGQIRIYNNVIIKFDLIINSIVGDLQPLQRWGRILSVGSRASERFPLLEFLPVSTKLTVRFGTDRDYNDGFLINKNLTLFDIHHIKMIFDQNNNVIIKINDTVYINQSNYRHSTTIYQVPIYSCSYNYIGRWADVICADVVIKKLNITSYDNYAENYNIFNGIDAYHVEDECRDSTTKDNKMSAKDRMLWSLVIIVGVLVIVVIVLFKKFFKFKKSMQPTNNIDDNSTESSTTTMEFDDISFAHSHMDSEDELDENNVGAKSSDNLFEFNWNSTSNDNENNKEKQNEKPAANSGGNSD